MTFPEFFHSIWSVAPFPWQEQLAELALRGEWPTSIGLPTAAGKTAALDIAVFALAMGARNAPRRVFFVVDRRLIVDEATERAKAIEDALCTATPASELGKLAQRLRELGRTDLPLMTATLRGGIPRESSWTDSPLQPLIVCSTVDQIGSSLLFRAYGASQYARPIRAGLAAYDSLIILDEAHTSQPFAETLRWIGHYRTWAERPLQLPLTVVEMSATPREGLALQEGDKDCQHPVLKRRWDTEKRAALVLEEDDGEQNVGLVKALAREARTLRDHRGASVIGVIANRVRTARQIHDELVKDDGCEAVLLTGRARPYDRDRLWNRWKPRIGVGRQRDPESTIFVVATQCIEVGANIDFDGLVTEIASIDALEQRFGRLARNGNDEPAYAAIVAQKSQVARNYQDSIYGDTLATVWRWLKEHTTKEERTETVAAEGKKKARTRRIREEFVPMGVLTLRSALRETASRESLTMPRASAPVLMPAHLDLLSQTSPEPACVPEPAVFLHGPKTEPADVQLVWRQDLDSIEDSIAWSDVVAICPPSAAEAIALPVWAVRQWLAKETTTGLTDLEGLSSIENLGRNQRGPVLDWRGEDESRVLGQPEDVRPGMTIVAPAAYGGCDEWGWNPESQAPVRDVGDAVRLQMGQGMLRVHPQLARQWNYQEFAKRIQNANTEGDARAALKDELDRDAAEWVANAVARLRRSRTKFVENPADGGKTWAAAIGRSAFEQDSTRSSYTVEVSLRGHLQGCANWAVTFARDLPEPFRESVIRAAELHDIGKADPRFQAWLRGGNPIWPDVLLAKSGQSGQNPRAVERARTMAGYPKGARHELMSVALLAADAGRFANLDFDLLLHLVGSHHGRCRPLAPVIEDDHPVSVSFESWSSASDHRLELAGSGVSERYWRLVRRYGWYGLCFLEAVVRLSDHRQSESEQETADSAEAANARD